MVSSLETALCWVSSLSLGSSVSPPWKNKCDISTQYIGVYQVNNKMITFYTEELLDQWQFAIDFSNTVFLFVSFFNFCAALNLWLTKDALFRSWKVQSMNQSPFNMLWLCIRVWHFATKKFPTQHVTAGYLARPYPKGEPKKTSLGGPFRHLKFDKNWRGGGGI